MTYRISEHTLAVFAEDARERFCKRVLESFREERLMKTEKEGVLNELIRLSKQAEEQAGLSSEAGQYSYIMAVTKLQNRQDKVKQLHQELNRLPEDEETRLDYLDTLIDNWTATKKTKARGR